MAGAGGARGGGPRGSRRGAHGGDVGRVRAASSAGPRRRYRASSSAPKAGSRREIIVARRDVTSSSSRLMSHSCAFQGFLRHSASARERCRRAASARPPARRRRSWMDASGTGRRSESSNPNRASKPRGVRSTPPARPFESEPRGCPKSRLTATPTLLLLLPRASQVDPRGREEQEQRVQMGARDRGAARRRRGVRTERTGEAVRGCPHRRGHPGDASASEARNLRRSARVVGEL